MNVEKLRTMMNTFVMFQFSYCPFVWMFHDRSVNKKINKIQERALRIAYKDGCSSLEVITSSVSIHQRNVYFISSISFFILFFRHDSPHQLKLLFREP